MIHANSLPLILKAVKRNCRYRGLRSVYHIPDLSWHRQWGYNKKIVEQTYRFLLCRRSTSACCISDNGFCFAAFGSRGTPDFALRGHRAKREADRAGKREEMIRKNQIWKIYGTEYKTMTMELLEKTDLAALISDRNLRIGIKPNLVCPTPADFGATTHPEIVAGILEYLQEHGFSHLVMAEGSWVGDKTSEALEYCGYRELSEHYGVEFKDTKKLPFHTADCGGLELNLTDIVNEVDFWINVPVLKGHCQTKMTCALKNMKGLLPDSEKRRFHRMGLHKPIAHLSAGIRQNFIVVDHICGDPDFEEGGNPLVRNCVMASRDPVLTDSYACALLGLSAADVPYISMAEKLGTGTPDLKKAEIICLNGGSEEEQEEKNVASRRVLDVAYAVEEVDSCSACYGSLIPALYRLKEEGLLDQMKDKIAIGQGHQGKTGKLGIGRCTKNFAFSVPGCPPDEEKIYQELKKYILAEA